MITPAKSAAQGLVRAYLEVVTPKNVPVPIIPLRFNPTEYQLQKSNNFAEIPIPGLESPPIQFIRGTCEKLVAELLADTSDTLEDVRKKYTGPLRELMRINADMHAPPIVRLMWAGQAFKGVIEALNITYTLFTPQGVPIRAPDSLDSVHDFVIGAVGAQGARGLIRPDLAARRFVEGVDCLFAA